MTRIAAGKQIDDIRAGLNDRDQDNTVLIGIVRDLWDDRPIKDIRDGASYLRLSDWDAGQQIKDIIAAIAE